MNRKDLDAILHSLIEVGEPSKAESKGITLAMYCAYLRCELINVIDAIRDEEEDDDADA